MATKKASTARMAAPHADAKPSLGDMRSPPWTTEERLQRIDLLGQRIASYIQYIGKVAKLAGMSAEAKDVAVASFYERLLIVERDLGRIHAELELG